MATTKQTAGKTATDESTTYCARYSPHAHGSPHAFVEAKSREEAILALKDIGVRHGHHSFFIANDFIEGDLRGYYLASDEIR